MCVFFWGVGTGGDWLWCWFIFMPVSTVLHFSQENVIRDLELNEVYGQCKKHPLPSRRRDKEAIDEAGESKKEK